MSRDPAECVAKAAEYRRQARNERGKARDLLIDLARYWETLAQRNTVERPGLQHENDGGGASESR